MGYRLPPPHEFKVELLGHSVKSRVHIDNGTITGMVIPCFYRGRLICTRYEIMVVDHAGWPEPRHPDHSHQLHPHHEYDPIDLGEEGYDSVLVCFDSAPTGLSATGVIDEDAVKVTITAMCPSLVSDDADVPYAVYVLGDGTRSVVAKGIMHISAGPIQ